MKETTSTLHDAREKLSGLMDEDIPFKEKARGALEVGRQYLTVENGHLTRIDRETDHWEAIVSTDDRDGQFPTGLTLDLGTTYCRRTLTADSPITLHDAPNQGWETDPAFEAHELHCYHGTTLRVDGELYGTVCFVSEDPRQEPFSETETLFIEHLTQSLERELEREQYEAEITRQTNLSTVLNRILRHNLRNDTAVIRGFTQLMAEQLDDAFHSEIVLTKIDRFMTLCEKARELDQIIAAESRRESAEIVSIVNGVVERVAQEYPAASFTVEYEKEIPVAVFPTFRRAIREIIENAAKHGGDTPTIAVSLELVPNGIEVQITDDGPGLARHEADVLDTGTETALTHGTGLGLWLSYWIITGHDGSINATGTENGTTVSITIPRTGTSGVLEQPQTLTRPCGQYHAAFEEAGDGMTIINDEARIVDANPEAAAIYGTERRQLLGRSIRDFLPEDFDFDNEWSAIQSADTRRAEMPITTADGGVSAIEYTAKSDIVPGLHLLISRDITERKERERELTEIRERFQTFIENSHDIISIVDADGIAQYQSPAIERILGYTPDRLVGEDLFEYIHPDDREHISDQFETLVTHSKTTSDVFEYRFKHADGSWVWLESTASNRTATVVDGFVINSRDITERKEQRQALEETTERLESIIELSPDPILSIDTNGTIRVWNDAAEDVFGFAADAVIGEGIRSIDLFEGEQANQFEERFERVIAGETIRNHEVQLQTERGDPVYLSLSAAPLRAASDRIIGAITVATDITEYREREQKQNELKRQYQRLCEAIPDPVFVVDAETGAIVKTNTAAEKLLGADSERIVGRDHSTLHPPEDAALYREIFEACQGGPETIDRLSDGSRPQLVTASGDTTPVEFSVSAVSLSDGPVTVGVFRDISQRVERETDLEEQNDRLETFASIVSHDLRNPLSVAEGRLELAAAECDSEHIEHIGQAHDRMYALIEDLLTLARTGETVADFESVDLETIATSCWETVSTRGATLVVEGGRTIQGDRSRLKQFFENLIRNAIEHGGEEVTVTIGESNDGFYVEDDGPGIPEDRREKIFEAGYSTNQDGTGFGLKIVEQIATAHGWKLSVTESSDGGTRFEITGVDAAE